MSENCAHCAPDHNDANIQQLPSKNIILIIVSLILFIFGMIFKERLQDTPYLLGEYSVFLLAYLLSGYNVLSAAVKNIIRGKVFDENFLMTVATVGAILIHELPEAVGVMLFYKVGELLQDLSVSKARRSIKSLLEVRPDYANLKNGNDIQKVKPEVVKVGDTIIVKPGEKIPLDGEILSGESQVNTSMLTGESVPRDVAPGKTVLGGMINQTSVLTIKVTKLFSESSVAKIMELVENATANKAKTEKFITKFAQVYTPIIVICAALIAFIPPFLLNEPFSKWIYRALVLLVISCPCGLVISIPLGYFGGVGGASRRGILVKGSHFLDLLAQVKTVVFDKTGTLTQGLFKVTKIVPKNNFKEEEMLRWAAHAEANSNHPIAKSILEAYGKNVNSSSIQSHEEIPSHGIKARIENRWIIVGNDRFLHKENIQHDECQVNGTVVHLVVDKTYAGYIMIGDELKPDAAKAVQDLRNLGVKNVVMLTGDSKSIAKAISDKLGLNSYLAELLPEDKVKALETLMTNNNKEKVAFVGDGVNDAPVIARADIGMAMGGVGSDVAVETADVVLMTDAPVKVAEAIRMGKRTAKIVWQNVCLSLGIKGIFIVLGIMGVANMWEAVFADMGVALLSILNATRLLK
ncbi:MAG: cadmium-translocating P-type ATPase [Candidatus Omnitrophica bacterium]|nr:cadmium-translocating P-type ATPase [Candidatus Omnitrophota bacterium]